MSKEITAGQKNLINETIIKDISEAIRGLSFGTVTIKVNQSRIVQIEVTQNKRFDDVWTAEGGGGI